MQGYSIPIQYLQPDHEERATAKALDLHATRTYGCSARRWLGHNFCMQTKALRKPQVEVTKTQDRGLMHVPLVSETQPSPVHESNCIVNHAQGDEHAHNLAQGIVFPIAVSIAVTPSLGALSFTVR